MNESPLSVIASRHCKRAFLDRPVPRPVLERVLSAAGNAPSPRNTQLWQVAVLQGEARDELSRRLLAVFDAGIPREADYASRPATMGTLHEQHALAWAAGYYAAMGIARDDRAGRDDVERRNIRFYGAPTAMIFHLPGNAVAGTFLEMGLFLQNVMLGLVSCGLGSCPQFSVARYAKTIRDYLGLGSRRLIVCGLSIGYVDESAPINGFHPERARVEDYTTWHDYAPSASAAESA
jgi:nitroreductase